MGNDSQEGEGREGRRQRRGEGDEAARVRGIVLVVVLPCVVVFLFALICCWERRGRGHRLRRGRDRRHGALNDRERLDALAPNHRLPLQLRRDVVALRRGRGRGRRGQPTRHGARRARPGSLRLARVAARRGGHGRARARALVVRVQAQWSSVHRGVTWMSCDESSGRWLEPTQQRQGCRHCTQKPLQFSIRAWKTT
ncbi:hypothetical protein B0H14DRAFT_578815 [Mycena olivaceomarginata]|nr:hypothetical protein B0H14DRAFT_578815 [Mycena olivaceomarginata]